MAHTQVRFARWLALAAAIALSGCGWFSSSSSSSSPGSPPAAGRGANAAACPAPVILRPLSQTPVFAAGQPKQPAGVAFYGVLSEAEATCERTGDALRVKLDIMVLGERGPAAGKGNTVEATYFVAVTGPDRQIIDKRLVPVRITIPETAKRTALNDHIEETVPTGGRSAGELGIVVGFQQGPDAVEFYKNFRGR